MASDDEAQLMGRALEVAATARRLVSPRPWVGAVVRTALGGHFEGATDGRHGPHAEVVALGLAGADTRGATMAVTLEPCAHVGRTGPCADAVIAAGIRRCVVGIVDPDPRVAGEGIARLRAAGVDVEVGVCATEVERQLAPYLTHRRTGRPHVVLKLAATLDGRTAAPDGSSQWITGEEARADAHRLRADSDAVLVGAGTVRADDPALTVRLPPGGDDGTGPSGRGSGEPGPSGRGSGEPGPSGRGSGEPGPLRVVLGRAPAGARIHPCLELDGDLGGVLDELGGRGVLQVLVEGGASVAHGFHDAGLVDRYVLYLAPALFGGDDARSLFAGTGARTIGEVWRGEIVDVRRLGADLRVDLLPARPAGSDCSKGPR